MKILIVEDEMTSRVILEKILSSFGEVQVSMDGVEAIEVFSSALEEGSPFDLVCMDFMMPEMDGRTALTRIREMERDRGIMPGTGVKVIMATGLSTIESEYDDITAMCDAIIQKPVRKDVLLETLGRFGFR